MVESVLALLVMVLMIVFGANIGKNITTPSVRESTIKYCIESPKDCKKEYDFNVTRLEIEKLQSETKN